MNPLEIFIYVVLCTSLAVDGPKLPYMIDAWRHGDVYYDLPAFPLLLRLPSASSIEWNMLHWFVAMSTLHIYGVSLMLGIGRLTRVHLAATVLFIAVILGNCWHFPMATVPVALLVNLGFSALIAFFTYKAAYDKVSPARHWLFATFAVLATAVLLFSLLPFLANVVLYKTIPTPTAVLSIVSPILMFFFHKKRAVIKRALNPTKKA